MSCDIYNINIWQNELHYLTLPLYLSSQKELLTKANETKKRNAKVIRKAKKEKFVRVLHLAQLGTNSKIRKSI